MAETFFVRLSDAGTATWGAFDATGRLVGSARARRADSPPSRPSALGVATALVDRGRRADRRGRVAGGEPGAPAANRAVLARGVVGRRRRPDGVRDRLEAAVAERRRSRPSPKHAWTNGSASCASAGIVPHAVVLRGRRYSRHPGDARAHHRRRPHRRPQARAAAVRVRGPRVRSCTAARVARAQRRRARAAPRSRVHGRGWPRDVSTQSSPRSPASSRAPTSRS